MLTRAMLVMLVPLNGIDADADDADGCMVAMQVGAAMLLRH